MTIGLLRALQKRGMRVPQDMAVVGYDDLDFGDVLQPRMTVIAQPISEIATKAVDFLISRITGKAKAREPQTLRLAPTFIHRESCGCGMVAREQFGGGAGLSLVKGFINGV
jgi:LacI family transcriptional regulator